MVRTRTIRWCLCWLVALCILVPASEGLAALILKGGHTGTPKNYMHITLVRWSDLVKERTKGEIVIEVYPSEQLGNERTLLENTNLGTIDWCLSGSGGAVRFVPAYGMFENAYTFQTLKHFENVAFNRPFMQKMSDLLEQKSNMVLGGFQWLGNRSLLSKKPVKSPEDAKGMKLRVPDVPTYRVVAQALGGIPSPLPFGEVYMALKQGVVDGVEGTPENMINMKFFEAAKNYTLTNHMIQASAVYINKNVFYNKLSKEQQKIVIDSAYEAWLWFFKQNDDVQKEYLKKLEESGVNVIRLASVEPFRKRALDLLKEKYIPEWGKTWEEFSALAK
jgi:tripartite ATP-independent transporter DctP family solute receptor